MAEIRETQIEYDAEGNVVDRKVIIERPKRRSGFGIGMLFGVVLIAGALLAFVYSQGSFQQAGAEADQATAQIERSTEAAVDQAQQAANETSDSVTN